MSQQFPFLPEQLNLNTTALVQFKTHYADHEEMYLYWAERERKDGDQSIDSDNKRPVFEEAELGQTLLGWRAPRVPSQHLVPLSLVGLLNEGMHLTPVHGSECSPPEKYYDEFDWESKRANHLYASFKACLQRYKMWHSLAMEGAFSHAGGHSTLTSERPLDKPFELLLWSHPTQQEKDGAIPDSLSYENKEEKAFYAGFSSEDAWRAYERLSAFELNAMMLLRLEMAAITSRSVNYVWGLPKLYPLMFREHRNHRHLTHDGLAERLRNAMQNLYLQTCLHGIQVIPEELRTRGSLYTAFNRAIRDNPCHTVVKAALYPGMHPEYDIPSEQQNHIRALMGPHTMAQQVQAEVNAALITARYPVPSLPWREEQTQPETYGYSC